MSNNVLIVGAGNGLSASLARTFNSQGFSIGLLARNINKIKDLSKEVNGKLFQCDVSNPLEVKKTFQEIDVNLGNLNLVIFNPSKRIKGPIEDFNVFDVKKSLEITCYGGFLIAQQAIIRMLKLGKGAIFFTGASASVKGYPNSSVFAMGKFGLRGLAQSLARELHPQNIHIAHFVIDGKISKQLISEEENFSDCLDPDEIAKSYLHFFLQDKSCWSWELELRPWIENF